MERAATDAAGRRARLRAIRPAAARDRHDLLRDIFAAEVEYRREQIGGEYFENIYRCALLLHKVGDPTDVPMMWAAKHLNFDLSCGFDVEFMVGAGVARTVEYLRANGDEEIAEALGQYPELGESLPEWESFRTRYFYRQ